MEVGSINFQSSLGVCTEYISPDKKKNEITIVISPLKVSQDQDGDILKVISGCNMWKSCHNKCCQFSLLARPGE